MFHDRRLRLRSGALLVGASLALLISSPSLAHVIEQASPYMIAFGWQHEPTYVGEQNAVQVVITDPGGSPVTDLGAEDLKVVVSTGGQQSQELTFDPGYDEDTGLGTKGEYDAAILPTVPGDYTFHLTGSIHGTKVDFTETSSDATFDVVKGTTDIEFPAKLPSVSEIATRLDRIDARVQALPQSGPTQDNVAAASAAAKDAGDAAQRALLVGAGIGLVGVLVGALGVFLALRARPRTA
jgi:hypothetical protein